MAPTFRALSDPSRRLLLDRLFERDGQTLGELCTYLPAMTRFGVMRHLGVLEEAGLITTRREGREKRHRDAGGFPQNGEKVHRSPRRRACRVGFTPKGEPTQHTGRGTRCANERSG
jgi:DNA-binding transcriptional ArsR family regulator